MEKLDLKDRKILYQLDLNSRQSLNQIGKKVGLKKDVVSYRINKLIDDEIIVNFYTVINAYKLGYCLFRFYINFQYVNVELKKEIIKYFSNYKNICTVGEFKGVYDLVLVFWVKNVFEFYNFWNSSLDKFGDYFAKIKFSYYVSGIALKNSYLLPDTYKNEDRMINEFFGVDKICVIDNLDYRILNSLALNARIQIIELAKKLDCSSQTVTYRIKKLEKEGIIQGFRVAIDISKLGYKLLKVDVYLREHRMRKKIINYLTSNPNVTYISSSIGLCDLEFEIHIESVDKLINMMEEISKKFPGAIKNYQYYGDAITYKETFLPEI